jgi:hypothetical protein
MKFFGNSGLIQFFFRRAAAGITGEQRPEVIASADGVIAGGKEADKGGLRMPKMLIDRDNPVGEPGVQLFQDWARDRLAGAECRKPLVDRQKPLWAGRPKPAFGISLERTGNNLAALSIEDDFQGRKIRGGNILGFFLQYKIGGNGFESVDAEEFRAHGIRKNLRRSDPHAKPGERTRPDGDGNDLYI